MPLTIRPLFHHNGRIASERLFLVNPTMAGGSEASRQPSWGQTDEAQLGRRPCRSSAARFHIEEYRDMVSDQALSLRYAPRRALSAVAVIAHRGVNEKQPLRGNTSIVMKTDLF